MKRILVALGLAFAIHNALAEDGYALWLRYSQIGDAQWAAAYRGAFQSVSVVGNGATCDAIRKELEQALPSILGGEVSFGAPGQAMLRVGSFGALESAGLSLENVDTAKLGPDGFVIRKQKNGERSVTIVAGNTEVAALYGTFHLLRLLQTGGELSQVEVTSVPRIKHRVLNHWDNLSGSIERGYAGQSLWKWKELPQTLDPRYTDYARACASIGINATVLNNVNAQPEILRRDYLEKVAALAEVFRPYGIRVMLCPVFNAPMRLDGLKTADPRDPAVADWWRRKADEIYALIPDFGGFLVKASSEGQPGPQNYGASHAEGANMMARAVAPHGGLVVWRAFVYEPWGDPDRAKCAYKEFVPLDGQFLPNVVVQVKNGPLDFQPREPFHPIFGAMPKTPLGLELQITKEYLGHSTHLVYLAPLWKEVLDADTFSKGPGSSVARVVEEAVNGRETSLVAGVANTGSERNWCGHHFDQANWYAFGRLAWDSGLSSEAIADEWIRATWSVDPGVIAAIKAIMLPSREVTVNYISPLGLHFLCEKGFHYAPQRNLRVDDDTIRPDWKTQYYHRAGADGIGFDRSPSGSDAVSQYHPPVRAKFSDPATCPEEHLLWFHHLPWTHRMKSGRTLWQELQERYNRGVADCERMREEWRLLVGKIDPERHREVLKRLDAQVESAHQWQATCLKAFGAFAGKSRGD